jgi:hypothetical protein
MFDALKKFFNRSPRPGDRKESAMADNNPAPAAGATQPDLAAQLATLAGVVTALAESQKGVVEAIAKIAPAPQQATQPPPQQPAAGDNKPLTRTELVNLLNERDTQTRQAADLTNQRQRYAAEKLKDLPPVYATQLGNDPAKWAAEETALRQQYRGHLEASGVKIPDVSGNPPASTAPGGTTTAAGTVDLTKASPVQAIAMGLRTSKAAQAGGVAPARRRRSRRRRPSRARRHSRRRCSRWFRESLTRAGRPQHNTKGIDHGHRPSRLREPDDRADEEGHRPGDHEREHLHAAAEVHPRGRLQLPLQPPADAGRHRLPQPQPELHPRPGRGEPAGRDRWRSSAARCAPTGRS